ncbi:MAG: hypothetical protein Q8927_04770 [Bacteroidota bacterium]|nr:hypothetical protein [Bacteroidota bacterium]
MANINGNNIDDLFRQASDKYPLRTDSSDWAKLSDALEKEPSLIQPSLSGKEDRRRRRLFWLFLLLLPMAGAGYLFWQSGTQRPAQRPAPTVTQTRAQNPAQTPAQASTQRPSRTASGITVPSRSVALMAPKGFTRGSDNQSTTTRGSATGRETTRGSATRQATTRGAATRGLASGDLAPDGTTSRGSTPGLTTSGTPGATVEPSADPLLAFLDVQRARTSDGVLLQVDVHRTNQTAPIDKGKTAKVTKLQPNHHSFYAGLLVAPDLSTIRFQTVKSVGTTYGVLLGYTFNAKWSLETGVYIDRKKYFTEGQYFNKEKVPPLRYVDLQKVDGICNMVELPLSLRYNLGTGNKVKWFTTAGLSTYLMSSEWYNYQYLSNGNPMTKAASYRNPSQNWFSIVNLSVGYEQKLGSIGNLRLEPYLRVPLSGIGTGSLPIMSAGLNIGITRRIW